VSDDKETNLLLGCIGQLLLFPVWYFECYVMATLWRWFLMPIGLPAVDMRTFFGVNLIVAVLWFRYRKPDPDVTVEPALGAFVVACMCLGLGWLVKP